LLLKGGKLKGQRAIDGAPKLLRRTRICGVNRRRGGRPCIRGMRLTVGVIVGQLGAGHSVDEVLREYPYLEKDDIQAALAYAAWRSEEIELPLKAS